MALPPLIAAHFENHRAKVKTPIEEWFDSHPGVPLQVWCQAMAALWAHQSDWAYRNGPLKMELKYNGEHGWRL